MLLHARVVVRSVCCRRRVGTSRFVARIGIALFRRPFLCGSRIHGAPTEDRSLSFGTVPSIRVEDCLFPFPVLLRSSTLVLKGRSILFEPGRFGGSFSFLFDVPHGFLGHGFTRNVGGVRKGDGQRSRNRRDGIRSTRGAHHDHTVDQGASATIARLRRTPERGYARLGSQEMEVDGTEILPARKEGRGASKQRQGTKSKALERRIELISAVTIAVIISAAALHWMQPVMVPLILAVAVSQVLLPVVDFQIQLIPMPRPLAVGLSLLFTFAVVGFVGLLLFSSIKELVRDIKMYEQNVKKLLDRTAEILRQRGVGFDSLNTQFEELHLADMALKVTNYVFSQAFVIVELTFLVLLFSVYLLLGQRAGGIPVPRKGMVGRIESRIKRYLSIKFVISVGVGISTSLVFVSLQVHLAVLWGFLNFLLNFIPNVGPIIATMIPIPLILVSAETSGLTLILAIALPTSLHIFWGYILEPKVMGDSLDLHPISVMLCLIFWGMLWGIPGMFMAAPITAALKIVFEAADITRPFARLLGGHLDSGDEVYEGDDDDTEEEGDTNPAYLSKETDKLV